MPLQEDAWPELHSWKLSGKVLVFVELWSSPSPCSVCLLTPLCGSVTSPGVIHRHGSRAPALQPALPSGTIELIKVTEEQLSY